MLPGHAKSSYTSELAEAKFNLWNFTICNTAPEDGAPGDNPYVWNSGILHWVEKPSDP